MPRIKPDDIEIAAGDWVYLNVKKNAIWKDQFSGVDLNVWGQTAQQVPDFCDEEDIRRIKTAIAFGRLFVSRDKPPDKGELAQKMGERDIQLRELITHSASFIKGKIGGLSNTELECLHNFELQKPESLRRKTVLKMLEKKITAYAAEFAVGIEGGGKEGMIGNFVRPPLEEGKRPLKKEPPDTPLARPRGARRAPGRS
jgi:hypothetical protein